VLPTAASGSSTSLAAFKELAGNHGLGATGGKQLAGLQTDSFERLAVAQTAGVAAVGGWSHPARLPGHPDHVIGRGELL
jgi:hypothetical protein